MARIGCAVVCGILFMLAVPAAHAQSTARDPKVIEAQRLLDSSATKDQNRGASIADAACSSGIGDACAVLATAYREGRGVRRDLKKSFELSLMACELGSGRGCGFAGVDYDQGEGTRVNTEAAATYFRRGCDLRDLTSCSNLGRYHMQGGVVPRDVAKAVALFETACRAGNRSGCANLGDLYDKGESVPQDLRLAQELYDLSCDKGYPPACERAEALARRNKWARFPSRYLSSEKTTVVRGTASEVRELTLLYVPRGDNVHARAAIEDILQRKVPSLPLEAGNAPISPTTGYVTFAPRGHLYVGELMRVVGKERRVLLTERYSKGKVVDLAREFAGEVARFIQNPPTDIAGLPLRFPLADESRAAEAMASRPQAAAAVASVPAAVLPAAAGISSAEFDAATSKVIAWLGANTIIKTEPEKATLAGYVGKNYSVAVGKSLTKTKRPMVVYWWDGERYVFALSDEQAARLGLRESSVIYASQGTPRPLAASGRVKLTSLTFADSFKLKPNKGLTGSVKIDKPAALPAAAALRVTVSTSGPTLTFYMPLKDVKRENDTFTFTTSLIDVEAEALVKPVALFVDFIDQTQKPATAISDRMMIMGSFTAGTPAAAAANDGRAAATMKAMRVLATALEQSAIDRLKYPAVTSLVELRAMIQPTYVRAMPMLDGWGHAYQYFASADGKHYRIVSSGSDGLPETDWGFRSKPVITTRESSNEADDIVFEDGMFLRYATQGK